MIKIFGFNNGGNRGFYDAVAITEDGRVVGNHICSSEDFCAYDLARKNEAYDKHCGKDNWTFEFIKTENLKTHTELNRALDKLETRMEKFLLMLEPE